MMDIFKTKKKNYKYSVTVIEEFPDFSERLVPEKEWKKCLKTKEYKDNLKILLSSYIFFDITFSFKIKVHKPMTVLIINKNPIKTFVKIHMVPSDSDNYVFNWKPSRLSFFSFNINGKIYNNEGPAVIWSQGHVEYWLNEPLSKEEWEEKRTNKIVTKWKEFNKEKSLKNKLSKLISCIIPLN